MDYGRVLNGIPIFCDNTSATAISDNPIQHSRAKHIDVRHHFIREHIEKGIVKLIYVPTEKQLADIFTKPLDETTFNRFVSDLGMLNMRLTMDFRGVSLIRIKWVDERKMSKPSSSSHKFSLIKELELEKSEFEKEVDLLFEEMNLHLETETERIKKEKLEKEMEEILVYKKQLEDLIEGAKLPRNEVWEKLLQIVWEIFGDDDVSNED
ncbi:uncharacterized protein LOC108203891 [Daucus carota subsp. sativus]|uniref:uncharacterized protein LOC108203891 n=1 Tax=Daucus carota subsp. sativus TaxID=79200 RepID=UPI0007EFE871|nr:PREDICTED: uncharacterized protein LOC108203891 [Daucus carota subsp. sativus]